MWVMTSWGCFSILERPEDRQAGTLTVEAVSRGDLDRLRERYLPMLGAGLAGDTGGGVRARAPREAVAIALASMVRGVEYPDLAAEVGRLRGADQEAAYRRAWAAMARPQEDGAD